MLKMERYPEPVMGLPLHGRCLVLTNSELSRLACLRRFWFSEIEHLKSRSTAAMDMGTLWDHCLEDVFRYVQRFDDPYPVEGLRRCAQCLPFQLADCPSCKGTGSSALDRAVSTLEEAERLATREHLERTLKGWLLCHHGGVFEDYAVIGVQLPLARPIPALRGELWLEGEDTLYLARTGAIARNPLTATWPVYYLGRLDVLLKHRTTGKAWVLDAKFTRQPGSYEQKMQYDPQLPGYAWLVAGHLEALGLSGIGGILYDATSSTFHADPRPLAWKPPSMESMKARIQAELGISTKGLKTSDDLMRVLQIVPGHGGFSQAQNITTPSWRYEAALQQAGLDPEPYAEHLDHLRAHVDPQLYRRPWLTISPAVLARFERELVAKAQQVLHLRAQAAQITRPAEVDSHFPRTAICQLPGGHCAFASICAQDDPAARADFPATPTLTWNEP